MKLPVFWPEVAEVWFAQADAQFAIRTVTVSKTKLYHAVAVLPQEVALQILDLIRAPPAGDPYGVLRKRLITLYALNEIRGPGLSPSLWRSEVVSSDEQDACSAT